MNFASYLHFAVFLSYFAFAGIALYYNRKAFLNIFGAALFAVLGLWSLTFVFFTTPDLDPRTLETVVDYGVVVNLHIAPFVLLAFLTLHERINKRNLVYFIVPLIAYTIFTVVSQFSGQMAYPATEFNEELSQWDVKFRPTVPNAIANILYFSTLLAAFGFLIYYGARTKNEISKKRSQIILITSLMSFALGSANIYLPRAIESLSLPMFPDFFLLIPAVGILYATAVYRIFEINPATAAYTIVATMPDGLILTDENGEIVSVNKAFERISGRHKTELIGLNFFQFLNSVKIGAFDFDKAVLGEFRNEEIAIRSEEGALKYVLVSGKSLEDDAGKNVGAVYIFKDIEKLKKAERKLKEINEKLEEKVESRTAELLASKEKAEASERLKTAFLANISHEIRTPMNAIMGFAELIADTDSTKQEAESYAEIIRANSGDLLAVVDNVIELSKIESGELETMNEKIDPAELIASIFREFEDRIRNAELEPSLFIDVPRGTGILSDEQKIRKMINALVHNAIKFTEVGRVEIGAKISTEEIDFFVNDTGIGVPDNKREEIFDRFSYGEHYLSREKSGAGLGLAIAAALAELIGTRIELESKTGVGSKFSFKLPVAGIEMSRKFSEPAKPETLVGKIIIVAEEDPDNLMLHKKLLELTGAIVIGARNGDDAVEAAKTGDVDLALIDLKLPKIDGATALKLVRAKNPTAKTLLAISAPNEELIEEMKTVGADGILIKPFSNEELLSKIRIALNEEV